VNTASLPASPRALGYRMPAEWSPHTATWIAWPHNAADWPGRFQPIPWVYAEIVRHLSRVERVHILVQDAEAERRVRGILRRAGAQGSNSIFHRWPTNRVWTRDSGPIFVTRAEARSQNSHRAPDKEGGSPAETSIAVTDWIFSAWAKYDDWQLDNQFPSRVAEFLNVPLFAPSIRLDDDREQRVVLEGGSIDTNGAGTLLTTEECLLSSVQARNPGLTREQIEGVLGDALGIDQVLWLNRGIAGDDTHGHVDDIARFVDTRTIVTAVEPNREDENHLPLAENLDRLQAARSLDGAPFRIVKLPMPSPVVFEGQRLPASYANFYIANGLVLVPTFNDPNDRHALGILAEVFPRHTVTGIHCGDFIWGLGGIHCMTQQQPAP
jgi:agmatine deiminase